VPFGGGAARVGFGKNVGPVGVLDVAHNRRKHHVFA